MGFDGYCQPWRALEETVCARGVSLRATGVSNVVEMELSAARGQCMDQRVSSLEELTHELQPWQEEEANKTRVRWAFDVPTARTKLERVYPSKEARQRTRGITNTFGSSRARGMEFAPTQPPPDFRVGG